MFHGCVDVRSLFYSGLSMTTIAFLEELEINLTTNLVRNAPVLALADFSTFTKVHSADESLMYEIIIFEQIGRQLNKGLLGVFKASAKVQPEALEQGVSLIFEKDIENDRYAEINFLDLEDESVIDFSGDLDLIPKVYLIRGVPVRPVYGYFHDIECKRIGLILPFRGVCSEKLPLVDFENLFNYYLERMLLFCAENNFALKSKFRGFGHYYITICQPRYFDRLLDSIDLVSFVNLIFQERFEKFELRLPRISMSFPWFCSSKLNEMIEKVSDLGDFVGVDISMRGATVASVGIATFGLNGLDVLNHVVFPGTKEDSSPFYSQSTMRAVDSVLLEKIAANCVFFCLGSASEAKMLIPRVRGLCFIDLHNLFGCMSIEKYCTCLGIKKTNLHDSGQDAKVCLAIFFYLAFLFNCQKFSRFKKLYTRAFSSIFATKLKFK